MKKNIIFDFDGVIINSHDLQKQALLFSYYYVTGKKNPPYEEFFSLTGNSLENIVLELGLPLSLIDIYRDYSIKNRHLVKVNNDFYEILKYLKEKKVFVALCTGKDRSRTVQLLEDKELKEFFDVVICSNDVKHAKPDIESLDIIVTDNNLDKKETIFIGDGINDILCAQNYNMESVAVTWGESSTSQLKSCNPTYIVETPKKLISLLQQLISN